MTKFWTVVTLLLVVGLVSLVVATDGGNLKVKDLETECRYDRAEEARISLTPQNTLSFEGQFPVENTNSELDYSYSSSGERIVLNVKSDKMERPESFVDACLGVAIYDMETPQLGEGSYEVTVRHNGEKVERQRLRVIG